MRKQKINTKAEHNFLNTIGNNLYALRMARRQSLKTVAKAVKISPDRLSKIEKGVSSRCRFGTLCRLSKYYKIKLKDIASDTKGSNGDT